MKQIRPYVCPHCGNVIKEVNVVELNAKQLLASAGLGLGVGLIVYPILPVLGLIGAVASGLIASLLTFLFLKRK